MLPLYFLLADTPVATLNKKGMLAQAGISALKNGLELYTTEKISSVRRTAPSFLNCPDKVSLLAFLRVTLIGWCHYGDHYTPPENVIDTTISF